MNAILGICRKVKDITDEDLAAAVLDEYLRDGICGDVDGGTIHELATREGVFVPCQVTEPCGDACTCAEVGGFPTECYRLASDAQIAFTEAEAS